MNSNIQNLFFACIILSFFACKMESKNHKNGAKTPTEHVKADFSNKNTDNSNSDAAVNNSGKITFLFDASKDEMAGNADWVIDADKYDRYGEANPSRFPTPSAEKINANSPETFWKGALSSWAVALVKMGYGVETLPANGKITYGSSQNPQDLTHYKVFVVCEPNIRFDEEEKKALMTFVKNGGGLFMIADHDRSDRNRDNWDSPKIWNDFIARNGVQDNAFGFSFDLQNHSDRTNNFANDDIIFNGKAGKASKMEFHNGTSMSINTSQNSAVKGLIYKKSASVGGDKNAIMLRSAFGKGKIVALGDSSPVDDGSGDNKDKLFDGWSAEADGDHARAVLNASIWLAN